jgi:hypothetical protein
MNYYGCIKQTLFDSMRLFRNVFIRNTMQLKCQVINTNCPSSPYVQISDPRVRVCVWQISKQVIQFVDVSWLHLTIRWIVIHSLAWTTTDFSVDVKLSM